MTFAIAPLRYPIRRAETKPLYGQQVYYTADRYFYVQTLTRGGKWVIGASIRFQYDYRLAYIRFEELGMERLRFPRRTDALTALIVFLQGEGFECT